MNGLMPTESDVEVAVDVEFCEEKPVSADELDTRRNFLSGWDQTSPLIVASRPNIFLSLGRQVPVAKLAPFLA